MKKIKLFLIFIMVLNCLLLKSQNSFNIQFTINQLVDSVNVDSASNKRITYTIPTGYKIDSVIINGSNTISAKDSTSGYTFTNVISNQQFYIAISRIRLTITTNIQNTTIYIDSLYYGFAYRVTYTIPTGYKIDSVIINGFNTISAKDSTTGYTFTNVTSNQQFYVVISRILLTITTNIQNTSTYIDSLYYGYSYRVTYTIPTGYKIDSVIINGFNTISAKDSTTGYTFTNVTSNQQIYVAISRIWLTITTIIQNTSIYIDSLYYGYSYRVTYTIPTGYKIDSVIINGVNTPSAKDSTTGYTFTNVTSNQQIYVAISRISLTITTNIQNTVITADNIYFGNTYRVTYTIPVGYKIDSVIINAVNTPSAKDSTTGYTFTNVSSNQQIYVAISRISLTITTIVQNTTITADNIYYGSTYRVTYSIPEGYTIDTIYINNIENEAAKDSLNGYTFNNITTNKNIIIVLDRKKLTITATIQNITLQDVINYGDNYRITYNIPISHKIDSFIINGVLNIAAKDSITGYTLQNIIQNDTVLIILTIKKFNIIALNNTGGSLLPNNVSIVNYGDSLVYLITPNNGYNLDSLVIDNVKINNVNRYVFTNVIANHSIKALFKLIPVPCAGTIPTPIITRNVNALKSNNTYNVYLWYLAGVKIDSLVGLNSYTPSSAGVYTLRGIDANGCYTDFSKKYYYAANCIIPTGRIGNGANIQANIVGIGSENIIIKWCSEILNGDITVKAIDFTGNTIYYQKVPSNQSSLIINKQEIKGQQYYIQVYNSDGEILQISDLINR